MLEVAVARQPDMFDFHYGDYDHYTENHRHLRGSAENLLLQLRCWRVAEQWEPAARLAKHIVDDLTSQYLTGAPWVLAQLLEECFLIAYYAHQPDQSDARQAAAIYAALASRDPEFRDEFLRHEIRVRANFSFLSEAVEFSQSTLRRSRHSHTQATAPTNNRTLVAHSCEQARPVLRAFT